jgi:hypothetical protein
MGSTALSFLYVDCGSQITSAAELQTILPNMDFHIQFNVLIATKLRKQLITCSLAVCLQNSGSPSQTLVLTVNDPSFEE